MGWGDTISGEFLQGYGQVSKGSACVKANPSDTVYVLGAGLNQAVEDWHSLKPPMLRDFFKVALKHPRIARTQAQSSGFEQLLEYIEKYWKKTKSDLVKSDFDIEECYTLIETQRGEAINSNEIVKARELADIEFTLKSLLAEVLSEFETFATSSDVMRAFGDILYKEKPTIISFNYDTITEAAIESGSRLRGGPYPESMFRFPRPHEVGEDEIGFSHFNWNRPLAYGIKFDKVQLHRAGGSTYVDGDRFYRNSQNHLYDWPVLKLHGSLNWFRFLPIRSFPAFSSSEEVQPEWMQSAIVHLEGHWWMGTPPDFEGWYLDPLVITPVLNKEELFADPIYNRILTPLWSKAKEALSNCKKLAVIGYSFSGNDFRTKKLFLEAFSSNKLDELVIVNPSLVAVEKARDLCHFNGPRIFTDLKSYTGTIYQKDSERSSFKFDDELSKYFEDGRRIVASLDNAAFPLTGAFWFYLPAPTGWRLFLVSSSADTDGTGESTSKVEAVRSSIQPATRIPLNAIILVSPDHPVAKAMRQLIHSGPSVAGIRMTGSVVNGFKVEDVYVYRMQ